MIVVLEILAVIGSFVILVMTGVTLGRKAMGLGRTAKVFGGHVQPQVMAMMTKSDTARQFAYSLTTKADKLQFKIPRMMNSLAKLMVIVNAFREVSERISLGMRKLGF